MNDQISTRDPLNAFLDYADVVVANASAGPLAGATLAVKDIYDVKGYPTGGGNPQKAAESGIATQTAPAVQKLLDAGAGFIGKTQTDELTFSLLGMNAHYPLPINPAAPERITGGSSSGSAAAVAGGLAEIATGSDTGGSVRAPASFCGLTGLRTTHGRISLDGTMGLAPSFDTFGWFARDAGLYEQVGAVLLGADPAIPKPERLVSITALDDLVLPDATGEFTRLRDRAGGVLDLPLAAVDMPFAVDDLYWAFRRLQASEAWAYHGDWMSAGERGLGPGVKERFEFGRTVTEKQITDSNKLRQAVRDWLSDLTSGSLIVMATVPGAAPLKSLGLDELQDYRERAIRLLCLSGLAGLPQISIPLGDVDGAPFGLSLLGPENSDRRLIRLAGALTSGNRQ